MSQEVVSQGTARRIDERVARLLKDVDAVEPPLDLDAVREVLELDRGYYSADNTGLLRDVFHKLQIGSKQVIKDPTRILDVVKERKLRALWVPQKRKILLDETLHPLQQRWGEGHEIIHSVIPHHQVLTLGDPEHTLSHSCLELIEAEANYGAGRLLYLGDAFKERLLDGDTSLSRAMDLAGEFGNSRKSGLWRTVESLDIPACGVCSVHPWERGVEPSDRVSHFIRSTHFINQFAGVSAGDVFRRLAKVVYRKGFGSIGEKEDVILEDIAGAEHLFHFECWANKYGVISLGRCRSARTVVVAV